MARTAPERERGVILATTALLLVVIVISAGLAFDLGNRRLQASKMQRAADSASIAGVMTLSDTSGNLAAARAEALRITRLNGIPDSMVTVSAVGSTRLSVSITGADHKNVFAFGLGSGKPTRAAEAQMSNCGAPCQTQITLTPPISGIRTPGTGDGFIPVKAPDGRWFSLNHHTNAFTLANAMSCVDPVTQAICAGYPKDVPSHTNNFSRLTLAPTGELWYMHYDLLSWGFSCWSPETDSSCGQVDLRFRPSAGWPDAGGAYPMLVNDRLYALSDDGRVYCVNPTSRSACGGYPRPAGMAALMLSGDVPSNLGVVTGAQSWDTEVLGTRLYTAYKVDLFPFYASGVFIDCFDTVSRAACTNWPSAATPNGAFLAGMGAGNSNWSGFPFLFFDRDTSGGATGICAQVYGDHACFPLAGGGLYDIPGMRPNTWGWASPIELSVGTKTFFPAPWSDGSAPGDATGCWDWTTRSECPGRVWGTSQSPLDNIGTSDYAYTLDGECVVGLGHNSIWWSFRYSDYAPCDSSGAEGTVPACLCSDGVTTTFGVLTVPLDQIANLRRLTLDVMLPDGTVLVSGADLLASGGEFDLRAANAPPGTPSLRLRLIATSVVDGDEVLWDDPIVATIDARSRPALIR